MMTMGAGTAACFVLALQQALAATVAAGRGRGGGGGGSQVMMTATAKQPLPFPPNTPASRYMSNVVLAYTGPGSPFPYYMWGSKAFPPGQWVPAELEPLLSYQNPNQSQTMDTMFDSVWFVGTTAPSGKTVVVPPRDPWMNNSLSANESDWRAFFLAQLTAVRALENASSTVSIALGRKVTPTIMLTLPYPDTRQTAFGKVAGTSRELNFSRTADRIVGASWYAGWASEQFNKTAAAEGWSHVRFVGFYWVFETICGCVNHEQTGCIMCDTEGDPKFTQFHVDDAAIVPNIAAHVHSLPGNLMLNWIPYYDVYNAEWAPKWRKLGFDLAVLQPHVAYAGPDPSKCFGTNDTTKQFDTIADMVSKSTMGVEMEVASYTRNNLPEPNENSWIYNFELYLQAAKNHSWDKTALKVWFHAGSFLEYWRGCYPVVTTGPRACNLTDTSRKRRLYDEIYWMLKGTWPNPPHMGVPLKVDESAGGSRLALHSRKRPKLLLDVQGQPNVLSNGVSFGAHSHTFVQRIKSFQPPYLYPHLKIDDDAPHDSLSLIDQLSSLYRTTDNVVRAQDVFDVRQQPCWYLECENCTQSQYSWSAADPYWGHFNYVHQVPGPTVAQCPREQCNSSNHELHTERAAYTYLHLSKQTASKSAADCASACCADVRCDAWTFISSALHSWRPGSASSCIIGESCCLLKNGPTEESIRANSTATSGVVKRLTTLVTPPQGMRSAPPLGGIASGSVELRSDGSMREWTLYNQNPAGGVKFSKQDNWFVGIARDTHSAALRTHPPAGGIRGVESIEWQANHPTVKLSPRSTELNADGLSLSVYGSGTYVPGDMNTSSRPAIIFVLDADNRRGSKATNISLFLHASPNVEENQRRPAVSGRRHAADAHQDCLKACHSDVACIAWSWHKSTAVAADDDFACFLHNDVAPFNEFQDGAFSGVKGKWTLVQQSASIRCLSLERRSAAEADPTKGDLSFCASVDSGNSVTVGTSNNNAFLVSAFESGGGLHTSVGPSDVFGAIAVTVHLAAGERKAVNLSFGWHFPDRNYLNYTVGNFYSHLWNHSADAAADMITTSDQTLLSIVALHRSVMNSSLPVWMQDTLINSLHHIRSAWWGKDGNWRQWEAFDCVNVDSIHNDGERTLPYMMLWPQTVVQKVFAWAETQQSDGMLPEQLACGCAEHIDPFGSLPWSGVGCGRRMCDNTSMWIHYVLALWRWGQLTQEQLQTLWPNLLRAANWQVMEADKGGGCPGKIENTYDGLGFLHYNITSYSCVFHIMAMKASIEVGRSLQPPPTNLTAQLNQWQASITGGQQSLALLWNHTEGFWNAFFDPDEPGQGRGVLMSDVLWGQVLAFTLGLGPVVDARNISSQLLQQRRRNFTPVGLRILTGRDIRRCEGDGCSCTAHDDDTVRMMTNANHGTLMMRTCQLLPAEVGSEICNHSLALEVASMPYIHHNYKNHDQWNTPGILYGEDGNFPGQPIMSSHYGWYITIWHTLLATSGQLADLPRGLLTFMPAISPPLVLPFFLPGVVGQIGWSVQDSFNLTVHLGHLRVRRLSINGHNAPENVSLGAGEAIHWTRLKGDDHGRALSHQCIAIDATDIVARLPVEMSGAGCGIEYLNHEINGGLYSQLITDESFENKYNATTGLTTQWLAAKTVITNTTKALGALEALNGHQFLSLQGGAFVENRGVNRWGQNWQAGKMYTGSVFLASTGVSNSATKVNDRSLARTTVRVALTCSANYTSTGHDLAERLLSIPAQLTGWQEYHFNLTASGSCATAAEGGFVIEVVDTAARGSQSAVAVDFVTLHPGEWGLYRGLPVRKDLAEALIDRMRPSVLRMGGGSINARVLGDTNASNTSGWGRGYSFLNMRGPRYQRQPFNMVNPNIPNLVDQVTISSAGWGIFDFMDFCEKANVTAVVSTDSNFAVSRSALMNSSVYTSTAEQVTVIEKENGGDLIEYMWGACTSPFGGLRCRDGHPQRYQTERITIEVGNERLTSTPEVWCSHHDCVQAVLDFAESASVKATELGLPLILVLPFTSAFTSEIVRLKTLVTKAARSNITLQWDQHISLSSAGLSSVYKDGWPSEVEQMGKVTQQWQADASQQRPAGIRTVVLEENGDQKWNVDIHGLRRALNHAQVVSALQRVPALEPLPTPLRDDSTDDLHWASKARRKAAHKLPAGWRRPPMSQTVMSTQANCLQADGQNYYAEPPDPHANSWDQGTLFYNAKGEIWGQPTFWSAQLMASSHLPNVIHTDVSGLDTANASHWLPTKPRRVPPRQTPTNWSAPVGLDVISLADASGTRLTVRVVNPQNYTISANVNITSPAISTMNKLGHQTATIATLTARSANEANTAQHPDAVMPVYSSTRVIKVGGKALINGLRFPNGSLTVIELSL